MVNAQYDRDCFFAFLLWDHARVTGPDSQGSNSAAAGVLSVAPQKVSQQFAGISALVEKRGRIPSIDGLRAVSIALVLFDHLSLSGAIPFRQTLIDCGNLGVRIFFVISGFIITKLLMEERVRTGGISLRGFYARRFFRIVPIWACFVGATLSSLVLAHRAPPLHDLIGVFTFNADCWHPATVDFSHLWSLSVEEKFYLVWPLVMILATRRGALITAFIPIAIVPMIRGYALLHGVDYDGRLFPFYVSEDAIATGCCLALLRGRLQHNAKWQAFIASPFAWLVPVAVVGIGACHSLGMPFWLVGITAMNFGIAFSLELLITRPLSLPCRFLNTRAMATLGLWSYGMYLWQQPLTLHVKGGLLWHFPFDVVAALLISVAGYYVVERPAQEYGRRLWKRPAAEPVPLQKEAARTAAAGG